MICPRLNIIRWSNTAVRLRMIGDADKASKTFSEMSVEADSTFCTPGGGWPCHPLLNCAIADIDIASCSAYASASRCRSGDWRILFN
jgi:hypothetical protein